ncbi:hypothetical protein GCM10012288_01950 [Malaciobacter pacificus]|uniref:Uncharacterized protein n=1 Tax=Malaciobacter pacificus TaxID=1080223 RepID=A0A5C2HAW7_9BACT|nr:Opr family porin [Malaciobacter pacificus]QEP33452.1 hypothetical protein APAC_0290 [Malaciobacter pacificus]GGD31581.1 hypothetical protein GCM10012288_01950 [Malaciobacter pacificus]
MKKISLVACGLLLSSSMAFGANSIDEAFKSGTVSGTLTAYGLVHDGKGGEADSDGGYTNAALAYETGSYMGLSAKMGFIGGHAFADGELENDALMTEAYIKYATDGFALSVGRQAIDLEWLGDYNESVVAAITAIPDTILVLGYVNQQAAADEDEIGNFDEITEDGAYVVDVKYSGIEGVELNPYFYSAPDVAEFYGLKASYSNDMFGIVGQYAASSEDVGEDGSIAHIELSTTVAGVALAAGYSETDKDAGMGSITAYGDNLTPFDNGDQQYMTDSETYYGSIGYAIGSADVGVLFGESDTAAGDYAELNVYGSYGLTDSLSLGLLFVDYDKDGSSDEDYKEYSATLSYSF